MIRIGTASWTDPSLIRSGRFYPRGCSTPEQRLRYYADRFPLVEVDSSYYALPSVANAEKWAARTPDDFVFNLKAFRLFTGHGAEAKALPRDLADALAPHFAHHRSIYYRDLPPEVREQLWERFRRALEPLQAAGKLRAVLFQFAPWFRPGRTALGHLEECRARMPGVQLAVEFRDQAWFAPTRRAAVLDFERERDFANVTVDEPAGFRNAIPTVWDTTSDTLAILRLHGRNAATWNSDGPAASDRFNYDYPRDELAGFVAPLLDVERRVREVHVVFNNNYEDQGQRNAKTLMELLDRTRERY